MQRHLQELIGQREAVLGDQLLLHHRLNPSRTGPRRWLSYPREDRHLGPPGLGDTYRFLGAALELGILRRLFVQHVAQPLELLLGKCRPVGCRRMVRVGVAVSSLPAALPAQRGPPPHRRRLRWGPRRAQQLLLQPWTDADRSPRARVPAPPSAPQPHRVVLWEGRLGEAI
jgi:hypothetical protein